ncbi:MAG: ribbon-helix-helix domain-containing protein [Candidatus Thermoplasmatota archaeon]|nr:ribbon-helix-helix domain-containing protein [Candidatus Thermoplasmatota archaeon]
MGKYSNYKGRSEAISLRVPYLSASAIDDLIKKGIYGSRADFMKASARSYLRELDYLRPRDVKEVGKLPSKVGLLEECNDCEVVKKCIVCSYIK